jgi:hypothetical protein
VKPTAQNTSNGESDIIALYNFTEVKLAQARRMARSGQKDSARDWQRFIQNSRIVEILKRRDYGNPQFLQGELERLNLECHPAHEPAVAGDLNRIAGTLEILAHGVQMILENQAKGGAK